MSLHSRIVLQVTVHLHRLNAASAYVAGVCCRGNGREPAYVDLEANPAVDAEHPPDLKHLTDTAEPAMHAGPGTSSAASAQSPASATQNGVSPGSATKSSPAATPPQPQAHSGPQATDVTVITNSILSKVSKGSSVLLMYGSALCVLGDMLGKTGRLTCSPQLTLLAVGN